MLDYTAKMARSHHEASEADVQHLREVGFSDADILHIIYWIASFNMANTISDCVGLEVHEHMTAVFVDELPAARLGQLGTDAAAIVQREALRAGQERAVVRALEGHALEWLNSPPLTWDAVAGKALLVVYWDVTQLNSLLAVDELARWHATYADVGLVIIAAHTPEYPGAREPALVRAEVERLNITYPVVLDPEFRKMTGANNRYWPAVHVIDRSGYVRYRHYGPGGFTAIEAALQQVLAETADQTLPQRLAHRHSDGWLHPEATAEIYPTKFASTGLALAERVQISALDQPPAELVPGRLYLQGDWSISVEGANLLGDRGVIRCAYNAQMVGVYLSPGAQFPTTLSTRIDDRSPGDSPEASDAFPAHTARCYIVARHPQIEQHQLQLSIAGRGSMLHRISFLPFRADVDDDDEE